MSILQRLLSACQHVNTACATIVMLILQRLLSILQRQLLAC